MRSGAMWVVVLAMVGFGGVAGAQAQSRPAVDRPELMEVGDPVLISRKTLAREMTRNTDLRAWVDLYGLPDYAEIQEIEIDPPWAPYEVRLYYIKGNAYLAFGRVHVAPSLYDYGVRKYVGAINPDELDRLLTAQPAVDLASAPAFYPETAAPWVVETVAVEGQPVTVEAQPVAPEPSDSPSAP